jgi:predicted ATP-grasp superfamily ATP-dependent carboligase
MKVLLVSVVTREMAQSAVAAGYEVISLDYFGDSDQPAAAQVYSLARDFSSEPDLKNLVVAAKSLAGRVNKIVVGAGLENEPGLLDIGKHSIYWTNSTGTIQKVRDPLVISKILLNHGLRFPKTLLPRDQLPNKGEWLVKDRRHSGGLGVREWDGKAALQEFEVLQEKIDGQLMSACFLANGKQSLLIGLTCQYAGSPELGAPPFAWCGNTAPYKDSTLENLISEAVLLLTRETGLVGVNGIDFILHDDVPYLLEVNPRWIGSLELFERLYRLNMFRLHVNACQGKLPESLPVLPVHPVIGKGILYSRRGITLGDTSAWKQNGIADIPHPGETISIGAPICTVFSEGRDTIDCWDKIMAKAQALRNEICGERQRNSTH